MIEADDIMSLDRLSSGHDDISGSGGGNGCQIRGGKRVGVKGGWVRWVWNDE